jgi:predicted alpha-1,6-mannanase (GH76 family)
MAWLALALERAARLAGVERHRALDKLSQQFLTAWVPEDGGGIPWRKQDQFFNAPSNGPAGIFLARYGDRLKRAQQMADWIDSTLIDPETHLVFDGIKAGSLVRAQFTYCQGVVLGLETELAARSGDPRHAPRVHRLVAAINDHMTTSGVLKGTGGGDGGLFGGVTARYLALVATTLPGDGAADVAARDAARALVVSSARSAWEYRQTVDGLPLFGPSWDRNAELPTAAGKEAEFAGGAVSGSEIPERDLSVQLSGWMLMEAAHASTAAAADDDASASGAPGNL